MKESGYFSKQKIEILEKEICVLKDKLDQSELNLKDLSHKFVKKSFENTQLKSQLSLSEKKNMKINLEINNLKSLKTLYTQGSFASRKDAGSGIDSRDNILDDSPKHSRNSIHSEQEDNMPEFSNKLDKEEDLRNLKLLAEMYKREVVEHNRLKRKLHDN